MSICYMLWYPCSKCYMPKYIQLIRKAFSRKQRLIWALIETSRKMICQFSVMWHCLQLQYNIVVHDSIIHDIHISISVLGFFCTIRELDSSFKATVHRYDSGVLNDKQPINRYFKVIGDRAARTCAGHFCIFFSFLMNTIEAWHLYKVTSLSNFTAVNHAVKSVINGWEVWYKVKPP